MSTHLHWTVRGIHSHRPQGNSDSEVTHETGQEGDKGKWSIVFDGAQGRTVSGSRQGVSQNGLPLPLGLIHVTHAVRVEHCLGLSYFV